jgi:hypothetical protein
MGQSRDESKSADWEQCLHAARWIPCAYDMYCNLEEVMHICFIIEQGEALDLDDNDNNESNKEIKLAYDKVLAKL